MKEYSPLTTTVIRDGKEKTINSIDIVPGDIVIVASGDQIPADLRLVRMRSTTLKIDQVMKLFRILIKFNFVSTLGYSNWRKCKCPKRSRAH